MSNGVGMSIQGGPKPGDRVIPAKGIEIYIGPDTARRLEDATLDVAETTGKPALILRIPYPTWINRTRTAAPGRRSPTSGPSHESRSSLPARVDDPLTS